MVAARLDVAQELPHRGHAAHLVAIGWSTSGLEGSAPASRSMSEAFVSGSWSSKEHARAQHRAEDGGIDAIKLLHRPWTREQLLQDLPSRRWKLTLLISGRGVGTRSCHRPCATRMCRTGIQKFRDVRIALQDQLDVLVLSRDDGARNRHGRAPSSFKPSRSTAAAPPASIIFSHTAREPNVVAAIMGVMSLANSNSFCPSGSRRSGVPFLLFPGHTMSVPFAANRRSNVRLARATLRRLVHRPSPRRT